MNGDRVGYLDMRRLLQSRASVFASGRLQKGAYLHQALCVTLRLETSGWKRSKRTGHRLWQASEYAARRDTDAFGNGPRRGEGGDLYS